LTSLAASWLLFFLLYRLVPNTRVRIRPALVGSLVAAVLWELGKWGFGLYVRTAVPYSALYGSLGLILLFLFWIHLTWLIVLFGLELSYTLQAMQERAFERLEDLSRPHGIADPRWVIPMMTQLAAAFAEGKTLSTHRLAQDLHLPIDAVSRLANGLEEAGLVHLVPSETSEEAGYSLARPPSGIRIIDLLALTRGLTGDGQDRPSRPEWALVDRLDQAQSDAAGDATLASLL
jgi:membrane protein